MTRRLRGLVSVMTALVLLVTGTGLDLPQRTYRASKAGRQALEQGDPAAAVEHFERARELAPDDPRVLYNLGVALAEQGESDAADEVWSRAAASAEGTLARDAWYNRGVMALNGQDPERAVSAFSEALMIDPGDEEARENLQRALRLLRKPPPQPPQPSSSDQSESQEEQDPAERSRGAPPPEPRDDPQDQSDRDRASQQSGEPRSREGRREERPRERGEAESSQKGAETTREEDQQRSANREMAERLLDKLGKEELRALQRALAERVEREGAAGQASKGKDW